MRHRACRAALALLLALALCVGMNALAPLVDTKAMREHAAEGVDMLYGQGATPQLVGGFSSAQLDNFTSALIVKTATYTGGEPLLSRMFAGYRTDVVDEEGHEDWGTFCTYADGRESPTGGQGYARYWHGYTLPLRLLLCAMNLSSIQMLLLFAQTALLLVVLRRMRLGGLGAWIPGFLTAYFLLMPPATGVCLQYAPVTLLMLAACAVLLAHEDAIREAIGLPAFFALVGVFTNYVDLLTFPLVALGFPLVLAMLGAFCAGRSPTRILSLAALCCAAWGLGYGGMWAIKWLINGLVFGPEALLSVLEQAKLRVSTSADGQTISRVKALAVNVSVVTGKTAYRLLLAGTALGGLRGALSRRPGDGRLRLARPNARAISLLAPAAVVLLWYLVMANHSYQHGYFTYRNVTVCVLAGYACLYGLWHESGPAA